MTGKVKKEWLKRNSTAREGDRLYLTKPLGIGAVTTAHKRKAADPRNLEDAVRSMTRLNSIGEKLAENPAVHAMTDVTGFGLGGHLLEMAKGSHLRAEIRYDLLPVFSFTDRYLSEGFIPGGTGRNWETYGNNIGLTFREQYRLIADPQTSGGLLIAVDPDAREQFEDTLVENGVPVHEIGHMLKREQHMKIVRVI